MCGNDCVHRVLANSGMGLECGSDGACVCGRRPPLPVLFGIVLVLSVVTENVNSLLAYDRQTLLDIRLASQDLITFPKHRTFPRPLLLANIPQHLYTVPPPRRRQHKTRSRGKRGGRLMKHKATLGLSCSPKLVGNGLTSAYFISLSSLEPSGTWLVPIIGTDFSTRLCSPYLRRRGGVNYRCLQPLLRATVSVDRPPGPRPTRFALVNAGSLANKTFILNDFFITRQLHFLSITETWEREGESGFFTELLLPGCSYLSARVHDKLAREGEL